MGRTKTFDRDQAVVTVMNKMWKHGYEACSVKSISEKLGITRSSFYNTFGTREELFLEVLQRYFEQSPDRALEDIDGSKEVLLEICRVFNQACRARADDPEARGCLAINCVSELVGVNETLGPLLSEAVQASLKRFEKLLLLATEKGELPSSDIQTTALALKNLLIGINVLSKVVTDYDTLWAPARQTLIGLNVYKEPFDKLI